MTKHIGKWASAPKQVPSAAPKGNPIQPVPHFKPVPTLGKPKAGVDPRPIKDRGARGKARR